MRPAPGKPIEAGYSRRPAMVQAGADAFCTRGVGFAAIVLHILAASDWCPREPSAPRKSPSPMMGLPPPCCLRPRDKLQVVRRTTGCRAIWK